jgi:sec-independent protein translocase protein TatC
MHERWRVAVLGFFAAGGLLSPKGIFTMFLLALPASAAFGLGLAALGAVHRLRSRR